MLVATIDGFALAVAERQSIDADRLAGMVSSIGALGTYERSVHHCWSIHF